MPPIAARAGHVNAHGKLDAARHASSHCGHTDGRRRGGHAFPRQADQQRRQQRQDAPLHAAALHRVERGRPAVAAMKTAMAHGPNFIPFNFQERFGVLTVHMVPPALNWQPAIVSNVLPEPTSEIEQRTLEKALRWREFYQENPTPSNQLASICVDLIHIFQTTRQRYHIMRCHEAMWEKEFPLNLLTDPLHLFVFRDEHWYDVETLLPTDRRAKAIDYKRALATLRDYRKPLVHPVIHPMDAFQLDHTIEYFTERERQCRAHALPRRAWGHSA